MGGGCALNERRIVRARVMFRPRAIVRAPWVRRRTEAFCDAAEMCVARSPERCPGLVCSAPLGQEWIEELITPPPAPPRTILIISMLAVATRSRRAAVRAGCVRFEAVAERVAGAVATVHATCDLTQV